MGGNGITVLVVEDEALVRMDIALLLEDEGFQVLEASNADDAISLLDAHPEVRLMFTDIDMPGSMDGLKLAAAVRDRWPPVKIIGSSGHRHMSDDTLPFVGRFFTKPYDPSRVIHAIREMI
ncbi:CheY-like chemotaxis protein [Neorhizobium galegae]|uniref:response regulator n=1 Tax=Neorhizobium galegae TaxID=399 RepID=UPI001AE9FD86|nr:response regulator [Neorhizobium galegae]MBP2562267.1 CheY-like chemotaxis protein [Neorhizobium galegae]MDQ0133747.1 CheY-like chemotaxis protein [Neorhizobium galegae]